MAVTVITCGLFDNGSTSLPTNVDGLAGFGVTCTGLLMIFGLMVAEVIFTPLPIGFRIFGFFCMRLAGCAVVIVHDPFVAIDDSDMIAFDC